MSAELPIASLRPQFEAALLEAPGRPLVLSSPTGSGKSTEVPRWCAAAGEGAVLVIEPRRVACRSLAARVASLEATSVGDGVGYVVRDESVMGAGTRIVFATPGVVLRDRSLLARARTVILDEFHERSLDVDLLLALLLRAHADPRELIVMSATLDGDRVAAHVGGVHLTATGRTFSVDVRHLGSPSALPDGTDLAQRFERALDATRSDPGDVLVFLPGKAEIETCRQAMRSDGAWSVVTLHGGVALEEERRAFAPASKRKVILATNVAETSITIPGIGVVVDFGLVRQTRYHDGRAALVLAPVAQDSAAQRAGRAGRTAAGVCYRMWGQGANLAERTIPEIHRESLVPLVMCAAVWGEHADDLRWLDPPKSFALEAARAHLAALGAIGPRDSLTDAGRELFALPLDVSLARLIVEAKRTGCLDDAIDLVCALAAGRPMFLPGGPPEDSQDDLRRGDCDATALIRAVRIGQPDRHRVSSFALEEARRIRSRLRRAYGLADGARVEGAIDREALARTALAADPRVAHVARERGRSSTFSNGGTELELARESSVHHAREVEAVIVFDARAFGTSSSGAGTAQRGVRLSITCATPIPLSWIARARLGTDRLAAVRMESGRVLVELEHVYANRVVDRREESPRGEVAREAIAELFVRGSIFKSALPKTRENLALTSLAARLAARERPAGVATTPPVLELREWVTKRLLELGVESGDDLALLAAADLIAPEVPYESRAALDRDFPRVVSVGDATYEADYDFDRQQVTLRMVRGNRKDPPPLAYLPRFAGLRIVVDGPRGVSVIRNRG